MVLITGGTCQGKLSFCQERYGFIWKEDGSVADGGTDPFEEAFTRPVINRFHWYIRRILETNGDPNAFLTAVIKRNPDAVIIMDEVGCGIVPVSSEERTFREAAGKAGQNLAKTSDEVYRVVCGIGTRIK